MRNVVILTRYSMAEAQEVCGYLSDQGWEMVTVPREICLWNEEELGKFADAYKDSLAAVIHPAPERILGSIEQVSRADWDRACEEGPLSAWCVTKVFCSMMKEAGCGSMIYLDSIHAEKPVGNGALFSMSCGASQMLAREANQDYGEFGVNVFFVQKGITDTDPESKSPVSPVYFGTDLRYPSRKMPEKGYLNELIAFLLTEGAAPLSGSDLRADGGMTMFYAHRRKVEGRAYFDD